MPTPIVNSGSEIYTGSMAYEALRDPHGVGVKLIEDFVTEVELEGVLAETRDPQKVDWLDAHETYKNSRGLTIVQNHFTYALKLSAGDQSPLQAIPETVKLYRKIERFIVSRSTVFPSLETWRADELSFHLYDDQEVGLSRHRDNRRFVGLIAIAAIDGECDLEITHNDIVIPFPVRPRTLALLRAPGLIETDLEIRPDHAVTNLRTPTRTSMMLRANNRPTEVIKGFHFNNWNPAPLSA